MSDTTITRPNRRDFLQVATGAFAGVGTLAAAWPLLNSMTPSGDVLGPAVIVKFSLAGLTPGQNRVLVENRKLFVLRHRTAEEVAVTGDEERAIAGGAYVILVPLCTRLECVLIESKGWRQGSVWACPCCGSHYNGAGRRIYGPAPHDLEIPRYEVIDRDTIRLI